MTRLCTYSVTIQRRRIAVLLVGKFVHTKQSLGDPSSVQLDNPRYPGYLELTQLRPCVWVAVGQFFITFIVKTKRIVCLRWQRCHK
jgi:hypothetical protein